VSEVEDVSTTVPERQSADTAKEGPRERITRYLASLPERTARASAALVGGAVYETSNVALPRAIRQSKLYQVTIDRLLRILIEWVGDVRGVYDNEETSVQELAARKAAGNIIELGSIVAVGWSPLWLLAAASDLVGGSKAYLRALVDELQRSGYLSAGADVTSYEDLLTRLETGSGVLADVIDVPPMTLRDARASLSQLSQQVSDLPSAEELAALFQDLQDVARSEGRSPVDVSSALAAAAARAGVALGSAHVFDFYREALGAIRDEGLLRFLRRTATPYVARAGRHFDPRASTFTERYLRRARERRQARQV
jgi:hypothetical protein